MVRTDNAMFDRIEGYSQASDHGIVCSIKVGKQSVKYVQETISWYAKFDISFFDRAAQMAHPLRRLSSGDSVS